MRYLLDTNICSFALRCQHGIDAHLQRTHAKDLAISVITLAEAWTGVLGSSKPALWRERWEKLTADWHILPFDAACAATYARLRHELETRGAMIGIHDCQIAATALTHQLTVVTDNVAEFKRVPGLKVENWVQRAKR